MWEFTALPRLSSWIWEVQGRPRIGKGHIVKVGKRRRKGEGMEKERKD